MSNIRPGWEGVLKDGTKVRTVWVKDIPEAYWNKHQQASFAGSCDGGVWQEQTTFPVTREGACHGGVTKSHLARPYTCWVPVDLLEPEENEFGVISP